MGKPPLASRLNSAQNILFNKQQANNSQTKNGTFNNKVKTYLCTEKHEEEFFFTDSQRKKSSLKYTFCCHFRFAVRTSIYFLEQKATIILRIMGTSTANQFEIHR